MAAAFLGALSGPASGKEDARLMVSGSTTLLPVAMGVAEVFLKAYPNSRMSVSGTGTGEGLKSLIDGTIDIAGASRDILPEELALAEGRGEKLARHLAAMDLLAVIVHPSNPVSDLSLEQLEGIYLGRYRNWKELGGEDRAIVAINRDSSSGTFEMWLELVLKGKHFRRDAQVQPSSGGVSYAVGGNRSAVGYVGLGFLNSRVKAVKVQGVAPELSRAKDGSYPLSRELYFFTRYPVPPEPEKFLGYLSTEEGKDVLRKEGFLPPEAPDMRLVP
ncbi:MAG: phosphate ABC transporter substrate-binding protein [Deltaproteobacteria bacterium]|jgi:phosphate transport system substrate-binding protein|nr:phosphate ABC transporter substrate-binding protein [Deltaproteobacteria bacterium]